MWRSLWPRFTFVAFCPLWFLHLLLLWRCLWSRVRGPQTNRREKGLVVQQTFYEQCVFCVSSTGQVITVGVEDTFLGCHVNTSESLAQILVSHQTVGACLDRGASTLNSLSRSGQRQLHARLHVWKPNLSPNCSPGGKNLRFESGPVCKDSLYQYNQGFKFKFKPSNLLHGSLSREA